jgi:hypothetical protein
MSVAHPTDREKLCLVGLPGTDRRPIRRRLILLAAGRCRRALRGIAPATGVVGIGVRIWALVGVGRQQLIEFVIVEPGRVEGIAPTAMRQSQFRRDAQVVDVRVFAAVPRGMGRRRPGHHDVGAHAVDAGSRAYFGDLEQCSVGELNQVQDRLGVLDPITKPLFGIRILGAKGLRVGVEQQSSAHHLSAQCRVARRGHLDGEAEAVEQLRPQLTFFGIHRADEHELRRVGHRDAVAFDGDGTHGGRIEEQVDQMVVQEIDLVDVQDPAMRIGQQTRLEAHRAIAQRLLEVDRSRHAVLGGADRKFDQSHRPGFHGCVGAERAVW